MQFCRIVKLKLNPIERKQTCLVLTSKEESWRFQFKNFFAEGYFCTIRDDWKKTNMCIFNSTFSALALTCQCNASNLQISFSLNLILARPCQTRQNFFKNKWILAVARCLPWWAICCFFFLFFFCLNKLFTLMGKMFFFFLNVFVLNELWRWQDVYQDGVKGNML